MSLRCMFGHAWVLARVADSQVLRALKQHAVKWKSAHNRVCRVCSREELHADELELQHEEITAAKIRLNRTLGRGVTGD